MASQPTTVTSKGQVTIPKRIRDSMNLGPGSLVVFDVNDQGEIVLRREDKRKPLRPDRFERALGAAEIPLGCSVDEFMAMVRGYDE
jgi:AbrB family looped-hinge helix DNA binding protein